MSYTLVVLQMPFESLLLSPASALCTPSLSTRMNVLGLVDPTQRPLPSVASFDFPKVPIGSPLCFLSFQQLDITHVHVSLCPWAHGEPTPPMPCGLGCLVHWYVILFLIYFWW